MKNKLSNRYVRYLESIERAKQSLIRKIQSRIIVAMGAAQVSMINGTMGISKEEKAIKSICVMTDMAQAIKKVYAT